MKHVFLCICLGLTLHTSYGDPQLLENIFRPIGRVLNGLSDTTFGMVRGGIDFLNTTVSRIVTGAGTVTERIRYLLEELRQRMNIGIPELGLPILDPLTIARLDINFTHENTYLDGYLEEVQIRHLSKFRLDHVDYNLSNLLVLNLTFPKLDVTGYYEIKGKIGKLFSLQGKGPFWLRLYELSVGTISQLRVDRTKLPGYYVESMQISANLKRIENDFQNLMNDKELSKVFNKAITQIAPEGLSMVWPEIEPSVSETIKRIINDKLQDFEISNILERFLNVFRLNLNQGRISVRSS